VGAPLLEISNQHDIPRLCAAREHKLTAIRRHSKAEDAIGFEVGHLFRLAAVYGLTPDVGHAVARVNVRYGFAATCPLADCRELLTNSKADCCLR
jgi:hypothetical protein